MALDFLTGCFGWRPGAVEGCNSKTIAPRLWGFKALVLVPVALSGFWAIPQYHMTHRHPELSRYPYNQNVQLAISLAYISCVTTFVWIFVSSVLLFILRDLWILLIGIVDCALAITIAISISMEAQFLPGSTFGCNKGRAERWQVIGGQKSFFTLAAEFSGGDSTPESQCKKYVERWQTTAATLCFQLIVCYFGIFVDKREHSILNPWRPLVDLVYIIYVPCALVYDHVVPRCRLTFSYFKKLVDCSTARKDLKLPPPIHYRPQTDFTMQSTKLMRILAIEHVLLNVVDHMHMQDVINLSLTCRLAREYVYPQYDLEYRIPKLKLRCCNSASKRGCLYCNKKICGVSRFDPSVTVYSHADKGCTTQAFLPGLAGRRHVTDCQPYCRICYYKNFAKRGRGYKPPCKCSATDRSNEMQDVCRTCDSNPDITQMQITRHKRYQQQARDMANGIGEGSHRMQVCGNCKAELGAGSRWWICGICKGECRHSIHPQYVKKRKQMDAEMAAVEMLEVGDKVPWWKRLRPS